MPEISKMICFNIAHLFCSFLNSFSGKSRTYVSFSHSTVPVAFGFDKVFVNKGRTASLAFWERLHGGSMFGLDELKGLFQSPHLSGCKRSTDGERSSNLAKMGLCSRAGTFSGIGVIYFLLLSSTGHAASQRVPGVPRSLGAASGSASRMGKWERAILDPPNPFWNTRAGQRLRHGHL